MTPSRSGDILYMPSVHRGYEDYLNRREGPIGLLGGEIIGEIPRLDRDIRAIGVPMMKELVRVLVPGRKIASISTTEDIDAFTENVDHVVMPDEDVSYVFNETYLEPVNIPVQYESVFLRWDKKLATKRIEVQADAVVSVDAMDQYLIGQAVIEGMKSPDWWRQVGGLIVIDGEVVIRGFNRPYPTKNYSLETFGDPRSNFDSGENIDLQKCIHAEVGMIAQAAREGTALEGAMLVTSTFPCPVCARAIAEAGVSRVIYKDGYSMLDAQDIFAAKGIEIMQVKLED